MTLSPQMEEAWRSDWKALLDWDMRREKWRARLLEIEEHNLPDYDRPVKYMARRKIGLIERFVDFLHMILP